MTAENSRRTRVAKLKTANCQRAKGSAHHKLRPGHGHGLQGCAQHQLLLQLQHQLLDIYVCAVSRRLSFGHGKQLPCIQKYSKISMDQEVEQWSSSWILLAQRYPATAQNGHRRAHKKCHGAWKTSCNGSGLAKRPSAFSQSCPVRGQNNGWAPPQFRQMKVALSGSMFPAGSWMSSHRVPAPSSSSVSCSFLFPSSPALQSESPFPGCGCGLKQSASVWRKLKWQSSKFKRLGCQFFRGSYSAAFSAQKTYPKFLLWFLRLFSSSFLSICVAIYVKLKISIYVFND